MPLNNPWELRAFGVTHQPPPPLLPPVRVRLLATRRYINGGDPWCFRLSICLRQQGPPPGRLTEWTLLVQNLLRPTLAILSTEVSMPISDDAARAEQIRDIAEILARGLQRLSHARESSEKSSPDALSFRDTPCSVSTMVNGSGARERE